MQCPCQSGLTYADCCQPLHQGSKMAENAEQLMRSRYAAFVLTEIDYIVATTVPAQQALLNRKALQQWSVNTKWDGLGVLKFIPEVDKAHALVEFKAYYLQENKRMAHHELSAFVKIANQWYFLDPTVPIKLTMKQPCLCGSGKKFKQCCAPFLA
ncbi:preprotein translocase subunit SecA [Gallibacterium salpingitidis]|uniref:Preprotein translocase subunit SecA n=1 Tax=Gallibacterium salpingitidis TaxID=505341 RepID=A0AB36E3Y8_9PAST|nr:YchJ family protein [Gallibacterium salpingitidis]OBX10502.1 preprotein translocase subunit SecA [Gallibacterium salpingitidis]